MSMVLFAESELLQVVNAVLAFLTVAFGAYMAYLQAKLVAQKAENKDLVSKQDINEKLADEAIEAMTETARVRLKEKDLPPMIPVVAPVVPRSNSPTTEKQRAEARIATRVAKLAAAKLALGMEPPAEPERAKE